MSVFKRLFTAPEKKLDIIIVGAGKVGVTLADKLTSEGNDVTLVDKNRDRISQISTKYDIMGIVGNGSSYSTLIEAGVEKAELLIAVTDSDELNLLCCTLANKVGSCSTIARVRNPDYTDELGYIRDKLGISMVINPELEAAKEIHRILHFPSAISVNSFAKGTIDMVRFKIPADCPLDGISLIDFGGVCKGRILVSTVEREDEVIIPNGNFILQRDDIISIIGTPANELAFFNSIGMKTRKVNSAIIIGGGKTSFYLAGFLHDSGIEVKLIELDFARCQELSELLPDDIVITNGDGTDESLLLQENIETAGALIPLTGIDEENILLALYARRIAPKIKTVTKVNHLSFISVINGLEIGSVVYPRDMTAETIRTYVRAKRNSIDSNIETLYKILDDKVEAIEFKIRGKAHYINVPLRKLHLKDNLLIASILRDGKSFIPGGDDEIRTEDSVIIVTTHSGFDNIGDIFA